MLEPVSDRRPIRSREHRVWKALAQFLARRAVSPNAISIVGMLACLAAGAAMAATSRFPEHDRALWIAAGLLVQLRLICNMLDGMVAVARGVTSPVGELYNEVPDRISDMAALVGLGYAAGSRPELGYLAATLAVFVAYVRAAIRAVGAPSDFRGPMAKQQRMFLVTVAAAFMGFTPDAWQEPFWQGWTVSSATLAIIAAGCVITAIRRIVRAAGILQSARD